VRPNRRGIDLPDWNREQRESLDALDSGGSLRSSLASLAVVLASPAFVESVAPFIPAHTDWPINHRGWE